MRPEQQENRETKNNYEPKCFEKNPRGTKDPRRFTGGKPCLLMEQTNRTIPTITPPAKISNECQVQSLLYITVHPASSPVPLGADGRVGLMDPSGFFTPFKD
jgi:hypothetical protein